MPNFNSLWIEKYRPNHLDDLIIDKNARQVIEKITQQKDMPNILFVGSPGTGKTTLARIIVQNILKCDYLYINASDENGIDSIRIKVNGFAKTKSFDGNIKVIILDEMDFQSINAQAALRNIMETYAKYTRFILTANYKHKIIPALQSRCQLLSIKPDLKETIKRCVYILKNENINIPDDQYKKLVALIKNKFPDIRSSINELQKSSINNTLAIVDIIVKNDFLKKIHTFLKNKNSLKLREYLIQHEEDFQGEYENLLREFLNYIYTSNMPDMNKKQVIALISDHLYKSIFVIDKEINAFACFIKIEQIINNL